MFYGGQLVFFGYLQEQSFDTAMENGVREVSIPITSPIGVISGLYFNPIKIASTTTIGGLPEVSRNWRSRQGAVASLP